MKVAELKTAIEGGLQSEELNGDELLFNKWFNFGIKYALAMVDVYIQYQEPETGPETERLKPRI